MPEGTPEETQQEILEAATAKRQLVMTLVYHALQLQNVQWEQFVKDMNATVQSVMEAMQAFGRQLTEMFAELERSGVLRQLKQAEWYARHRRRWTSRRNGKHG